MEDVKYNTTIVQPVEDSENSPEPIPAEKKSPIPAPALEQLNALFSGEKLNDSPKPQTKVEKLDTAPESIPSEKLQEQHTAEPVVIKNYFV